MTSTPPAPPGGSGPGQPAATGSAADPAATPSADPATGPASGGPPASPVAAGRRGLGPVAAGALVFGTSAAVLVLEILSLRLLAPYLGLTLETNTAVIGIALAAIAAGAWTGGQVADRVDPLRLLGPLLLLGGALYLTVVPAVRWTGDALRGTQDTSVVLLIAGVAVFAPAALLSAVPPMVVKVRLASLEQTGAVVGRLSGISTLGAIVGTFVTGFLLVAALPTSVIVLAVGGALVLVGAVLTVRGRGVRAGGGLLVLALAAGAGTAGAPTGCEVETAYHCARVDADPTRSGGRILVLDTLWHSYVDLDDPRHLEFGYIRGMVSGVEAHLPARAPLRTLFLGGGGFTLPRFLATDRPGSDSLVYEIDRGVVDLDQRRLALRVGEGTGIAVRIKDARLGLAEQPPASRDLVVGDAFGGLAVPWHLTTREVVQQVRRVLRPGGLYALNVIDHPPLAFVRAEVATVALEFPHVALVARPSSLAGEGGGNYVVLASDAPIDAQALQARLADRAPELDLLAGAGEVARFVGGAAPLTDDHAPVDQLLTP